MENVSPTLRLILNFRYRLEMGESVGTGLLAALNDEKTPSLIKRDLLQIKNAHDLGQPYNLADGRKVSIFYRHLVHLISRGLAGESILSGLLELEKETFEACIEETEVYCARLPILALPPLLFFIFPAIMLLILGPVVQSFFSMP